MSGGQMTSEPIVAIVADSGQDLEGYIEAFADMDKRFVYYFNPQEASLNLSPDKFKLIIADIKFPTAVDPHMLEFLLMTVDQYEVPAILVCPLKGGLLNNKLKRQDLIHEFEKPIHWYSLIEKIKELS